MPINENLMNKIDETIEYVCGLAKDEQIQTSVHYSEFLTALAALLEVRAKLT